MADARCIEAGLALSLVKGILKSKFEGTSVPGCYIVSTVKHLPIHRSIVPPSSRPGAQNYIILQQNSISVDITTRTSNHAIQNLRTGTFRND
jgi:hypothetical protein